MMQQEAVRSARASPMQSSFILDTSSAAAAAEAGTRSRSKRASDASITLNSSGTHHRIFSPDDFKRTKAHIVLGPRARSRGGILDSRDIKRFALPSSLPVLQSSRSSAEPQQLRKDTVAAAAAAAAAATAETATASTEATCSRSSASSSSSSPHVSQPPATSHVLVRRPPLVTGDSMASKATLGPHSGAATATPPPSPSLPLPLPLLGQQGVLRPQSITVDPLAARITPSSDCSALIEEQYNRTEMDSTRGDSLDLTAAYPQRVSTAVAVPFKPSHCGLWPRSASSEFLREEAERAWANYRKRSSRRPNSRLEPMPGLVHVTRGAYVIPDRTTSLSPSSVSSLVAEGRVSRSMSPDSLQASFESGRAPLLPSARHRQTDQESAATTTKRASNRRAGVRKGGATGLSKQRRRSATAAALPRPTTRNNLTAEQRREQVRRMRKLAYLLGEESLQAVCWDTYLEGDDGDTQGAAPTTTTAAAAACTNAARKQPQFPRLRRRGSYDSNLTIASPPREPNSAVELRRPSTTSSLPVLQAFDDLPLHSAAKAFRGSLGPQLESRRDRLSCLALQDSVFLISDPNAVQDIVSPKAASILGIQHPFAASASASASAGARARGVAVSDEVSLASVELEIVQRQSDDDNGDGVHDHDNDDADNDDEEATPRLMSVESGGFVVVQPDSLVGMVDADATTQAGSEDRSGHGGCSDQVGSSREAHRRRLAKMSRWLGETIPVELVAANLAGSKQHQRKEVAFRSPPDELQHGDHHLEFETRPLDGMSQADRIAQVRRMNKLDRIFGAKPPAGLVSASGAGSARRPAPAMLTPTILLPAASKSASSLSEDEPRTPARSSLALSDVSTSTFLSSSLPCASNHNRTRFLAVAPASAPADIVKAPVDGRRQLRRSASAAAVSGMSFMSIDSSDSEQQDGDADDGGNQGFGAAGRERASAGRGGALARNPGAMDSLVSLDHSGESEVDPSLTSDERDEAVKGDGGSGGGVKDGPRSLRAPSIVVRSQDSDFEDYLDPFWNDSMDSRSDSRSARSLTATVQSHSQSVSSSSASMRKPLLHASQDDRVLLRSDSPSSRSIDVVMAGTAASGLDLASASVAAVPRLQPATQAQLQPRSSAHHGRSRRHPHQRHSQAFLTFDSDSEDDGLDRRNDGDAASVMALARARGQSGLAGMASSSSIDLARRDSLASFESKSDAERAAVMRLRRLSRFFGRTPPPPAAPAPTSKMLPPVPVGGGPSLHTARSRSALRSLEEESLVGAGLVASSSSSSSASKMSSLFLGAGRR